MEKRILVMDHASNTTKKVSYKEALAGVVTGTMSPMVKEGSKPRFSFDDNWDELKRR